MSRKNPFPVPGKHGRLSHKRKPKNPEKRTVRSKENIVGYSKKD
jgi:hypothetical protein